jgi:hypothetical protein
MIRTESSQVPHNLTRNLLKTQSVARNPEHACLVDLLPAFTTGLLQSDGNIFEGLVDLGSDGGWILFSLAVPTTCECQMVNG